jgi:protein-S-isoprenylcysteine O-methyltransferase Ste14
MTLSAYLVAALALLGLSYVVFQVIVKRTYLRCGRLGTGVGLLQAFMWGPFFVFPYLYNAPHWAWFWTHPHPVGSDVLAVAVGLITLGLMFVAIAMAQLGLPHSTGRRATTLHESGLYGLSRNPQIVAGVPLIVGLALLWPSWYALGWIAIYFAMAHMMVLAEEAHLRHRHGQAYETYCARVPRYVRIARQGASKEESHRAGG